MNRVLLIAASAASARTATPSATRLAANSLCFLPEEVGELAELKG